MFEQINEKHYKNKIQNKNGNKIVYNVLKKKRQNMRYFAILVFVN